MSALGTFLRWPMAQKGMALEALVLSGGYYRAVMGRPFKELSPKIGTLKYETPQEGGDPTLARQVRSVVEGVCKHTPWESACLVRALTAKKILNRRGQPCTLYMGVKAGEHGGLEAHAWLRCGTIYVTGGRERVGYTVTAVYGDPE